MDFFKFADFFAYWQSKKKLDNKYTELCQ